MKILVAGLWHLGCVTAACLAKYHQVIGYDPDSNNIKQLKNGQLPVFEPGLSELIIEGINSKRLNFSSSLNDIDGCEVVWLTFDTPIDENDQADTAYVLNQAEQLFPYLLENSLFIISSQIPIGTTRKLINRFTSLYPNKNVTFSYIPENLRLGKAIASFTEAERFVVGLDNKSDLACIEPLLKHFKTNLIPVSIESAEMVKHGLNSFLALSVTFINELAQLCELTGANAREVEMGLKTDIRIGQRSYLRPGDAIAGGTLARDVNFLINIGIDHQFDTKIFSAINLSNQAHKYWACHQVIKNFPDISNLTVAVLGLSYTNGTSTLRHSNAVDTCLWLAKRGIKIRAYEPDLKFLPDELSAIIDLKLTIPDAIDNADAVIITKGFPEYENFTADTFLKYHPYQKIFDVGGFLYNNIKSNEKIAYFTVGCCS